MPASFNLIDDPFVPVLTSDGSYQELGLRTTLRHAHDLAEVRDPSPLVTMALHRLLLAILHAAYRGPKTRSDRIAIRQAGRIDADRIDAYFENWKDRFDLFHPNYPFLQRAGFATKEPSGINRLAQELSRGNNAALFDHTTDDPPPAFTSAQAARAVIAEQAFAVGGGKSDTGNTTHAPLVSGAIVLARGGTLFETLWLNLTEYDGKAKPITSSKDDAPIWERQPKPPHEQSATRSGYLDYLVWPARTLALHPEEENGAVIVRRVSYAQGRKFEAETGFYDPMVAYFRTDDGDRPVRFNEYKDLWRDSASMFQFAEANQSKGPTTLHTLRAFDEDVVPRSKAYTVSLIGLCTDKAKVLFWRHESLPLPLAYLDDETLVGHLKNALELAEKVAKEALRPAAWSAAANRLTGDAGMNPDTDRVRALVDSMAPDRFYWSHLERPFRTYLTDLAATPPDARDAKLVNWYWDDLHRTAVRAFERSVEVIDTGRDLKAVTAGRGVLFANLKKVRTTGPFQIPDRQTAGAP